MVFRIPVQKTQGSVPAPRAGEPKATRLQRETAKKLGIPVEKTVNLGGGVTLKMMLIPPGEFIMGSPRTEATHQTNEGPQHRVRITKPFYMGKYEVTQEQWARFMRNNPSGFKAPKNPVEFMSWNDCQSFLKKLNASLKGSATFALPTEAEWEYACRAGTTTPFYTGNTISTNDANYDGTTPYGNGPRGRRRGGPSRVGGFRPNAFGLYDMHGNVLEWCSDPYDKDYYRNSPREDPQGSSGALWRVTRGGSWWHATWQNRSAYRTPIQRQHAFSSVGFRVVLRIPTPKKSAEADSPPSAPPGKPGAKKRLARITGGEEDLKNHQVRLVVRRDSDMRLDFGDLRFADNAGNSLSYWIEARSRTAAAVWVKVPSIPRAGTTITMSYGDPNATSRSNGNATFIFFDDFSKGFDTAKWKRSARGSANKSGAFVKDGILYAGGGDKSPGGICSVVSKLTVPNRVIVESRIKLNLVSPNVWGTFGLITEKYTLSYGWPMADRAVVAGYVCIGESDKRFVIETPPGPKKDFADYWGKVWFKQTLGYDGTKSRDNVLYIRKRGTETERMHHSARASDSRLRLQMRPAGREGRPLHWFLFDWIAVRNYARPDVTATIGEEAEAKQ